MLPHGGGGVGVSAVTSRPRVKLITIPWELDVATLSLASLAAVTPDEFDIAVIDALRERIFLEEPVDLVGISASTPTIKAAYALADSYRSRGVTVVIGGHHATAMPEEALRHADAVVCGEGEGSWMRICEQFLTRPSTVGGIYRDPPPDLSELPQPRIDLMKIERYEPFFFPVIASRGCPERCSFCYAGRFAGTYRTYPIAHILEQLRRRPASRRPFYFVDDNLPGDPEFARELFRTLAKYRIPFGMQARWEFARNRDDLELARSAGCVFISSGYESINQASLDNIGKRARAQEYRQVMRNLFDAGIVSSGNWVFGFDWDAPEIFADTLEFLDSSTLLHSTFTTEIPFPGTPSFARYAAEGRILTNDYDQYLGKYHVVFQPRLMTPDQLSTGVRHIALSYFSPRRAIHRFRLGMANPRFAKPEAGGVGPITLAVLNAFQLIQWRYQMIPALQRFYRYLIAANRFRFAGDHFRRTNFREFPYLPAGDIDSEAQRCP